MAAILHFSQRGNYVYAFLEFSLHDENKAYAPTYTNDAHSTRNFRSVLPSFHKFFPLLPLLRLDKNASLKLFSLKAYILRFILFTAKAAMYLYYCVLY